MPFKVLVRQRKARLMFLLKVLIRLQKARLKALLKLLILRVNEGSLKVVISGGRGTLQV